MSLPRLTRLDWAVAVDTVLVLAICLIHGSAGTPPSASFVRITLLVCGLSSVLLVAWMLRGGGESSLWNWLPPFWPLGRNLPTSEGRWLVVLAMVAGAMIGGTLQWLRS